jgi:hypothetical protein
MNGRGLWSAAARERWSERQWIAVRPVVLCGIGASAMTDQPGSKGNRGHACVRLSTRLIIEMTAVVVVGHVCVCRASRLASFVATAVGRRNHGGETALC